MNAMVHQDLLLTFENCSNIVIVSIHYLLNNFLKILFETSLKIKNIIKVGKFSFYAPKQKNPKHYFPKKKSLTSHLEY